MCGKNDTSGNPCAINPSAGVLRHDVHQFLATKCQQQIGPTWFSLIGEDFSVVRVVGGSNHNTDLQIGLLLFLDYVLGEAG